MSWSYVPSRIIVQGVSHRLHMILKFLPAFSVWTSQGPIIYRELGYAPAIHFEVPKGPYED